LKAFVNPRPGGIEHSERRAASVPNLVLHGYMLNVLQPRIVSCFRIVGVDM